MSIGHHRVHASRVPHGLNSVAPGPHPRTNTDPHQLPLYARPSTSNMGHIMETDVQKDLPQELALCRRSSRTGRSNEKEVSRFHPKPQLPPLQIDDSITSTALAERTNPFSDEGIFLPPSLFDKANFLQTMISCLVPSPHSPPSKPAEQLRLISLPMPGAGISLSLFPHPEKYTSSTWLQYRRFRGADENMQML